MDENQFEFAQRLEIAQRESGAAQAHRRAAPENHPDFDGTHCVRCDEPIPLARLALFKVRCVACQTQLEKHHG